MALQLTTPAVDKDGKLFVYYAVNLAMSPCINGAVLSVSMAIRITPYRVSDDGTAVEMWDDMTQTLNYPNAGKAAETDPLLARFLSEIECAGQKFISASNL